MFTDYNPKKAYCNDGTNGPANLCCYWHDKAYKEGTGTRAEADREFLKCALDRGLNLKAYVMYAALRLGGWYRWNLLRKRQKNG